MIKVEKNIAGRPLKIESGQIARQAGGSVFITYGETAILATVCCSSEPREGIDFLPMQVEYREKHYAGGKIPGGFFKREAKPTDAEVLTSRLTEISLNFAYSPAARPSELSNTSSIDALDTGFRLAEPLKITSAIDSPRKCLALDSPITQRTASIIFDLPHPFGPTTAVILDLNGTVVGSTNDLNPTSLILFKRKVDISVS